MSVLATKSNVVILTNGLSGSSVLSGLIARAGYWVGEETVKKPDYDTFENARLVELNKQLFREVSYQGKYEMEFVAAESDYFSYPQVAVDPAPYKALIAQCNAHSPWVWKDPRLWLSIHYWRDLLDLDQVKFIHLTRDPMQTWISVTVRRQIQEYGYLKRYLHGIRDSIRSFLKSNSPDYLEFEFEDLLLEPEKTIGRINQYLGTELTVDDLRAVYRGELYKKPKGLRDLMLAVMIYLKNYRERYR